MLFLVYYLVQQANPTKLGCQNNLIYRTKLGGVEKWEGWYLPLKKWGVLTEITPLHVIIKRQNDAGNNINISVTVKMIKQSLWWPEFSADALRAISSWQSSRISETWVQQLPLSASTLLQVPCIDSTSPVTCTGARQAVIFMLKHGVVGFKSDSAHTSQQPHLLTFSWTCSADQTLLLDNRYNIKISTEMCQIHKYSRELCRHAIMPASFQSFCTFYCSTKVPCDFASVTKQNNLATGVQAK